MMLPLDPATLVYFVSIPAINLTLALVVYLRNRRLLVNRLFAVSVFWVVLWTVSNYLLHAFAQRPSGLFWGQMTFAMASLIPPSFLAFAHAFPSDQVLRRHPLLLVFASAGALSFVSAFTKLIVTEVGQDASGLRLSYGPLYPVFAIYFVGCFASSFYLLWKKYRLSAGIQLLRLRYLFVGTLLAVAGGVTTNLLIPLIFNTSRFSIFGPSFTVFAFAFVAHAILRHRLMDIRVVIRRGVAYALPLITSGILLVAGLASLQPTLTEQLSPTGFILAVSIGLLAAVGFHPLLRLSQRLIDRYAYRAAYDPHRVLQSVTHDLSSLLGRTSVLSYLSGVLERTLRPEAVTIYLREDGGLRRGYYHSAVPEMPQPPDNLTIHDRLPDGLPSLRAPLVRDELQGRPNRSISTELSSEFAGLRWDIVLPISHEQSFLGLIILGQKLSGDPYFADDIDLCTTIAHQAGIVLANSTLYEEVKTVKEHIEGILRNMESGVITVSRVGAITTLNAVAEHLLGAEASKLLGQPVQSLPPVVSSPLVHAIMRREVCYQVEALLLDPTGRSRPIVLSTSLLRGSRQELMGAILVFTDHSKIKELEREKRQVERLAAFQAMASAIAHEIKNPLVAIKTFAELIPERFSDDDFRNNFSQVVIREIERIDDLVARLRGLAPHPSRQVALVDLRDSIDQTLSLLRAQLELSRITARVICEVDSPTIAGDRDQIEQLFLNLLMNAIEAMNSGGELRVCISPSADGSNPAKMIVLVEDSGPGIPEHLLETIFDPFVTTKRRGSGLGLSISRSIATAHQATIRAANRRTTRGTIVSVEFPAALEPEPTPKLA